MAAAGKPKGSKNFIYKADRDFDDEASFKSFYTPEYLLTENLVVGSKKEGVGAVVHNYRCKFNHLGCVYRRRVICNKFDGTCTAEVPEDDQPVGVHSNHPAEVKY